MTPETYAAIAQVFGWDRAVQIALAGALVYLWKTTVPKDMYETVRDGQLDAIDRKLAKIAEGLSNVSTALVEVKAILKSRLSGGDPQ